MVYCLGVKVVWLCPRFYPWALHACTALDVVCFGPGLVGSRFHPTLGLAPAFLGPVRLAGRSRLRLPIWGRRFGCCGTAAPRRTLGRPRSRGAPSPPSLTPGRAWRRAGRRAWRRARAGVWRVHGCGFCCGDRPPNPTARGPTDAHLIGAARVGGRPWTCSRGSRCVGCVVRGSRSSHSSTPTVTTTSWRAFTHFSHLPQPLVRGRESPCSLHALPAPSPQGGRSPRVTSSTPPRGWGALAARPKVRRVPVECVHLPAPFFYGVRSLIRFLCGPLLCSPH